MTPWRWLSGLLLILACRANQLDRGADKNAITDTSDNGSERLEQINGTPNYRLIKPDKNTPWFPEPQIKLKSCVREAPCESLNKTTCLGTKLPYDKTSVRLTFYENQYQIQTQLDLYRELINVPNCWAVIQPLLCATFMPKCEKILGKDMVFLPSYEMCKITMEPCSILYNTSYFPSFLKCNETLFPPNCENTMRELKFNTSGKCLPPLIHTDKPLHFYEGISGCGLPCRDPLYTEDEHQQIHRLVAWGAGVCLALNLLTVATFLIDWRSANKYPALVIFYINVCFAVASMGWLIQFGVGSRDDIVCSKDGTRRQGEPSAEENLSCVVVFVLVYYFMMAACVWFVIFTYAWHMSFRALGKIQDRIDKKAAYFHLVAWSLPLILTIATMAFGEVDGSSVTGICFVGYVNHPMRAALLLAPLSVVLALGGYFLLRGVFSLIAVRVSSKDVISPRAANKIRQTITRCSLTAALVAVFICVTFACHIYEFRNADLWKDSFKKNIICRLEALKATDKECSSGTRPSVSVLQLRLLCCFAAGALMASWTWTPAAAAGWRRYLARRATKSPRRPAMRARALLFLLVVYATYSHAEKSKFYYMESICKDHFLQRQYRKVDGGVLWSRNERNLDCTVTFQTHSILQRFMLHFDLLQLDCNDHLYVYDGAHATAPPKADLSCRNTKQQVGALFTRSNFVTLKYVTDNWGTDANGFRLVITAVKDPIPEHGCKEFRCKQREFCVSADLTCDGVDHCADGSDEDTATLCPESGGTGAGSAWVAGCAGAAALVAGAAATAACCACRRRAATQRTRLHLQELASSNGGGSGVGAEAGATRLPGNPELPAGPCGAARAGRLRRAA